MTKCPKLKIREAEPRKTHFNLQASVVLLRASYFCNRTRARVVRRVRNVLRAENPRSHRERPAAPAIAAHARNRPEFSGAHSAIAPPAHATSPAASPRRFLRPEPARAFLRLTGPTVEQVRRVG